MWNYLNRKDGHGTYRDLKTREFVSTSIVYASETVIAPSFSGSFTGSFLSGSYALSSSYATSASRAITASWAISSSKAISASWANIADNAPRYLTTTSFNSWTASLSITQSLGNFFVSGTLITDHILGNSYPLGLSLFSGAGTGSGGTVAGDDISANITINTGTTPYGGTNLTTLIATMTFNKTYEHLPRVIWSPANASASLLTGIIMAVTSVSSFSLSIANSALSPNSSYQWNVIIAASNA